jgi:putative membrane protein
MDSSMPANGATPDNTTMTPPTGGAMTDTQIFARIIAANRGEVTAGKMAESKATNADVKAFARQMVTDHTKMLNDVAGLAKRLNVTPDSAAADDIMKGNKMTADQLTAAEKGVTFDTAYVNGQVAGHQAVLEMIQNAASQAQNADLKQALNGAVPVVQHHLDRIKSIQDKMK